jgi:HAE1 family hydrophobic/amphiphilic exporter-1
MTTLATLLRVPPLATALGDRAQLRAPMAITLIGGLLDSTLLTLIVIPVVYERLDRKADAVYRQSGERHGRQAAALSEAGPGSNLGDGQGVPA